MPQRPLRHLGRRLLPIDRGQPVQQVGAVDQPPHDQMGDRHLGLRDLPLDAPLGEQQPPGHQRRPVAGGDVRVDH
jgi:hypothetical protein